MTKTEVKRIIKGMLRGACACAGPLFSRISAMTEDEARSLLRETAPKPAGTGLGRHTVAPVCCDLQIVIPAYNVEAYLEACMESVLSQETEYSWHAVLVDDGAKDSTPQICDRYGSDPRVTVIHQKNRGLSGARNAGMEPLYGRYVMFVDSDDILCPGAIQGLLDTAYAGDYDLVEGGAWYLQGQKQTVAHRYERDTAVTDPYTQLHGHAWGKLYKRELLENLCFPEGYWYEDSLLSFLVFPLAERIGQSKQMAYGYRINESGIVKSSVGKPRAVETCWITEQLLQDRLALGLEVDGAFFRFLLLQVRLNQLRLEDLEERVQEAAFVMACGLLAPYCPEQVSAGKDRNLIRALKTRDFGMFRMCCKFF